jgi:hypothetical protein
MAAVEPSAVQVSKLPLLHKLSNLLCPCCVPEKVGAIQNGVYKKLHFHQKYGVSVTGRRKRGFNRKSQSAN